MPANADDVLVEQSSRAGLPAEPTDRERAGARALTPELFDRLPRYEGHLSRELDRSLARYRRLQDERQAKESAVLGQVVPGHYERG